eukprot:CAMPEP_0202377444 /NCGR_PEP_ID=MMETSP1127-20130417/10090_1 /ASSEMBLY_ACC=CAM_ASM_000462 /TAXON_ID=3047 /ORGANISM="Dunaliella tertiolecta, Strain CCMP1320" /LENGTH=132 /DNA_ID=CAMNT_0048975469 /DNA_START=845 /DNA_END=1244 /DNA_ORIENTATION=+
MRQTAHTASAAPWALGFTTTTIITSATSDVIAGASANTAALIRPCVLAAFIMPCALAAINMPCMLLALLSAPSDVTSSSAGVVLQAVKGSPPRTSLQWARQPSFEASWCTSRFRLKRLLASEYTHTPMKVSA